MKKNIQYIFLFMVAAMLFNSCDLDRFPSDSLPINDAWTDLKSARRFDRGLMKNFRSYQGGVFTYATDIQSDLFNALEGYGNNSGDLYRWDFTNSESSISSIYEYNFIMINNSNNIIKNIDNVEALSENEALEIAALKGRAYFIRAMAYFTLVQRYAENYVDVNPAEALGLPLMTEYNQVHKKPSRASLEDTYKFIIEDLNVAEQNLKVKGRANAEYLTADVVKALQARVYLAKGDYKAAIESASAILDTYPLVSTSDDYAKYWVNDTSSEIILRFYGSQDERTYDFSYYTNYLAKAKAYSPYYIPVKSVVEMYDSEDIRFGVFFKEAAINVNNIKVNDCYILFKYPGNPEMQKTPYETYNKMKPFRIAEQYLILAEAYYKEGNFEKSKEYLNKLKSSRKAKEVTSTGDELFSEIKDEWIREFIGEGMRLDQLKRWGDSIDRRSKGIQSEMVVLEGEKYSDLVIAPTSELYYKIVWEIPNHDLKSNGNILPNWK